MKPQVEAFAEESGEDVKFFDMAPGSNRELLIELDVSGFPTFLFFKNGRASSYLAGVNTQMAEIREHTQKLLSI